MCHTQATNSNDISRLAMGKHKTLYTTWPSNRVWVSGKKGIGKFEPLTTFGLRLLKHIQAPKELPNEAGSVVEVSH